MSGFLFDTNVLLDIATADPIWLAWSKRELRSAAALGPVFINPINPHAAVENRTLVTRDAARYRTYFPSVKLIAPS